MGVASVSLSKLWPALTAVGALSLIMFSAFKTHLILTDIDYNPDHVTRSRGTYSIQMDPSGGSRMHTRGRYTYGTFSAFLKCPAGNFTGLVSTFYISSLEGSLDQDEIDFEFLGKSPAMIQTNYWVNGQGGDREQMVGLGFDCRSAFHKYTIQWTISYIKWFIDDELVRKAINDGYSPWPTKPSFV
ncbi:hypothetical protein KFL_009220030 [Klebsormidium nitens]|uniref:GH16 domain-containing protein n=1 Tax=Klebsormidium nitens TaxID=105231 RepID=A0A1Y1IMS2_KLENI|nr:hypothetical protein KFL_009220030 [Klebsormidium nitens]|eukprot:GAQ92104.1 hypothetical protein KFL_009220030 [Klebsormidium nitens]